MSLPNYIASREDWDHEVELQMKARHRGDPDGYAQAMARRYPVSIPGAVDELQKRGLEITEERLGVFCDFSKLHRIGRSYLFYPADIDEVAENLFGTKKITDSAKRRRAYGVGFREELDAYRALQERKFGQAAQDIGVPVAEIWAAVRCGGIHDPTTKIINIDEARQWFADHRQDAEFKQELMWENL